ncbi:MAG TPA: PAS domain S-box protein [Rhodoferax sp.]|nr:PAS domain S-box protein [Rhodoferax sp.]
MKTILKSLNWRAGALLLLVSGLAFVSFVYLRSEEYLEAGLSSYLLILIALVLAYLIVQKSRQRVKNLVHLETLHLLEAKEASNRLLAQANQRLQEGEEKLWVTLNSIGDAVIATDAGACVTLLNPVAEALTGWTQAQALGQPIDDVFHVVTKDTRLPAKIPVVEALANGTIQGLANHTVLIARDAREYDIADSCAPIRDAGGAVVGAVLVFRNISEEYAAQQSLRDSAALLQTILNAVPDGLVTIHAHGGIIETVNPAIELMFGYRAADLCGKHLSWLIPELDKDHHNGSLAYYGVSAEDRALGVGREVVGRREDGSVFPLEISVSEMTLRGQRYFTGILRDISARKQTEEALRKAGALQKAIFDSANFSSIATDAKGVIQIFNVGAERMLGYTAAEVMNQRTPADISDPQEVIARAKSLSAELETDITPGFEALVFKASRGIEDIYELTYIRKDGSRFPAVVSVTALRDDQASIIGYLLIGTDNTARKQVEAERARLDLVLQNKNVELERARQVADHANQAKSDFLSSMSHELRSPLNAILGFAQLLESGTPPPSPTQAASVGQILTAGWYLLKLINEILDLALIESGRLSLSLEPTSLHDVLQDCEAMIAPQAQQKGIRIKFASAGEDCFVIADRTRLKQVLVNLLSNAIKYNRPDGTAEVSYRLHSGGRLRISVRDSGEGLSHLKIAQLFQPFNRLGQEAGAEEGTGIGLVVSRQLVELMGGEIGVTSTVGGGSVFWFELNAASAPELVEDELLALPLAEAIAPAGASVRTLLYVEDNQANMALVEQLIARRPDMRLLGAQDAMRGIAMARAYQPDLILMDINLPGISGMQALVILQDDPATRHIPVLALSANAMPRDIEKGLAAGFYHYLTKPIRVSEFMTALDQGLAIAKARTKSAVDGERSFS